MAVAEPELPGMRPPQPRRARAEDPRLHQAAVTLRLAGRRVYRAGAHTALVDGKRVSNEKLRALASPFQRPPKR